MALQNCTLAPLPSHVVPSNLVPLCLVLLHQVFRTTCFGKALEVFF